jgi:hypothetical protein
MDVADAFKRHDLQKAHLPGPIEGERRHVTNFEIVLVLDDDGVELYRSQPGGVSRFDPLPDEVEPSAAGHRFEAVGVERIDRDVDAVESRLRQIVSEAPQQEGIRRHGDFSDAGERLDTAHQIDNASTDGRLTTGEADLVDSDPSKEHDQTQQLIVGEVLFLWLELHAECRHAVDTAEVAAVGQRDAKVGHRPAECVLRHPGDGRHGLTHREKSDWADRGACRHHPYSPDASGGSFARLFSH